MPTPDQHWARLKGKLTGLTDPSVQQHLAFWAGRQDELAAMRKERAQGLTRLAQPQAVDLETRALMARQIASLDLKVADQLAECVAEVQGELNAHGITWSPNYYIGSSGLVDGEFWTTDGAGSINIPWYLANEQVWRLVNDVRVRYTREDVMRTLRHETAHALGYAFQLWARDDMEQAFGSIDRPYRDEYDPDPTSRDYVQYLHRTGPSQNSHYAQKHPDEDWAETFATWIDPSEQPFERYRDWPGALAKLRFVDQLVNESGALYGDPPNQDLGKTEPYTKQAGTVGDFVGSWTPQDLWSPAGSLIRAIPLAENEDRLHDLYFGSLGRTGTLASLLVNPDWDKFAKIWADPIWSEGFRADFRQVAGASDGWVCTVLQDGQIQNTALPVGGWPQGHPLLVLDCQEHAWWPDFLGRKDLYLAACWRNLNWETILDRWKNGS